MVGQGREGRQHFLQHLAEGVFGGNGQQARRGRIGAGHAALRVQHDHRLPHLPGRLRSGGWQRVKDTEAEHDRGVHDRADENADGSRAGCRQPGDTAHPHQKQDPIRKLPEQEKHDGPAMLR